MRWLALLAMACGCQAFYHVDPSSTDAPPSGHDAAAIDARVIDARVIDAAAIDAAAIDAPSVPDARPDAPPATCPMSYTLLNGGSYRVVLAGGVDWPGAESACVADKLPGSSKFTHLLVAAGPGELSGLVQTESVWIGLKDTDTAHVWVTGENTGTFPTDDDPIWNTGGGTQQPPALGQCAHLDPTGTLTDDACIARFGYICECDDNMPIP